MEPLPKIVGAEFEPESVNKEKYHEILKKVDKKEPIRVLFSSEASFLCTGFSTYLRNIWLRLYKDPLFECAEMASYGAAPHIDPRAKQVPWKYYHTLPSSPAEEKEFRKDNENQFGKWKFDQVLADFQPDIVIAIRDNWHDRYKLKSPLRDNFLLYWMACVDSAPQRWEWLQDYNNCDAILAYSFFGKRVLEEQSRTHQAKLKGIKPIDVLDVCQSGVSRKFKPLDRKKLRQALGVPDNYKICGTVMRNQPRKLFDRLIQSFRKFKDQFPETSKDVYLLLHTSIPDVGWDIPESMFRVGLNDCILFTYLCQNCNEFLISNFIGSPTNCQICKTKGSLRTPNTQHGLDDDRFNIVYNLMDVYIQASVCEGDGIPVTEAKAAGCAVLAADYSALYEKNRNGGALPIKISTLYTEPANETYQWRALFDKNDLARKLNKLFSKPKLLNEMRKEGVECVEKYYDWDTIALKWKAHLLNAPIKDRNETWGRSLDLKNPVPQSAPPDLDDDELLDWLYKNILCRKGVDAEGRKYWMGILNQARQAGKYEKTRKDLEKHLRKLVEDENRVKKLILNPKAADPNPVSRAEALIEDMEK